MNFFDDSKLIILLRRNTIEFFDQKAKSLAKIEFPKELVRQMEISDNKKFEFFLTESLMKYHLGSKSAVIVLANEIVFEKIMPINNSSQLEQEFIDMIPFSPQQIKVKKIIIHNWMVFLAINIYFCQEVKKALSNFFKIEAMVPLSIFGEFDNSYPIDQDKIKQMLGGSNLIKEGDFNV